MCASYIPPMTNIDTFYTPINLCISAIIIAQDIELYKSSFWYEQVFRYMQLYFL